MATSRTLSSFSDHYWGMVWETSLGPNLCFSLPVFPPVPHFTIPGVHAYSLNQESCTLGPGSLHTQSCLIFGKRQVFLNYYLYQY